MSWHRMQQLLDQTTQGCHAEIVLLLSVLVPDNKGAFQKSKFSGYGLKKEI